MKIGLIALSGIRACDSELLDLGLTLPGFVERSKTIASLPSLGLLTLAGLTPGHHEVVYLEVDQLSEMEALPTDFDLVALSTFSAQSLDAYTLARRFRERGIPVVIGGLHVTSLPEEARDLGLTAAIGEGELLWDAILADAERGTLAEVYDARGREYDLREAPVPSFELLDMDRYNRITVQASRGCPWKCSFCASSILLTPKYKQKPVEKVLAEIDAIREIWSRPFIEFADDNAFVDRRYWKKLLPDLEKRNLHWFAETDLTVADDPELLTALRRAGCAQVLIGFESPVPAGLDGLERRKNFKHVNWKRYAEVIRRVQSHGIRVNACFAVGLDGHGPEIFDQVYDFVEDARPFDVQITYPTPFPGTPLYEELKAENRLTHDGDWSRCTLFDINYRPRGLDAEALRTGFHDLTRRLYSDEFTRWRKREFKRLLRDVARARQRRHARPRPKSLRIVPDSTAS